jgi:hypothetical protein
MHNCKKSSIVKVYNLSSIVRCIFPLRVHWVHSPCLQPSAAAVSCIFSGIVVHPREDLDALRRSCIVSGEIRARPLLTSPRFPNRAHGGRGGDCGPGLSSGGRPHFREGADGEVRAFTEAVVRGTKLERGGALGTWAAHGRAAASSVRRCPRRRVARWPATRPSERLDTSAGSNTSATYTGTQAGECLIDWSLQQATNCESNL